MHQAVRRDQHAGPPRPHHRRHQAQRRQGADLPGRRADQPVPARRRSRAPVPQGRPAGGDGRLPCRRVPVDAAGRAARDPGGHGHGHLDLRRRGRGRPARHHPARCLERHAEAALQLHGRPAGHRGRADAQPAAGGAGPQRRPQVELRSRPRLPVPVLVLHHHQRAGPQEPLPQRRRPRGDRPRELQAGHHVVLHHRRQHGPQQALGGLLRPADRAQGERGHRGLPDHPGRHPVPSHPELHPQGALGRRLSRVHRA